MFLAVHFLVRLALLAKSASEIDWSTVNLVGAFVVGGFYDLVAAAYSALPLLVLLLLSPAKWFARRWYQRVLAGFYFVALYFLLFGGLAEWLFWDEFGARFNFIAVDYLIYTTEVIGNIRESYPCP
jgi:hypothetical protein